ncbi:MAG: GNAT family N-acetyltransferase [Roseburia sp.]
METKDIDLFYNAYKNSISTIRKLEISLLKESYSFEKWSASLRKKSEKIRAIYEDNENMIRNWLMPFVRENQEAPEQMDPELAEMFMTHIDFFCTEGFRDYQVVIPVLKLLLRYYESWSNQKRLMDAYYFMGIAIMEMHRYEEAVECFGRCIEIYQSRPEGMENYRLLRMMYAHYYRLLAAICREDTKQEELYRYQREALHTWTVEMPLDFLTEKKKTAIKSILHSVTGMVIDGLLDQRKKVLPELLAGIEEEYEQQAKIYGDIYKTDSRIYVLHCKSQLVSGRISEQDYRRLIWKKWEIEYESNHSGFDYGVMDFTTLYDRELADEDFAVEHLFFMNPSYTYIYYLVPELLKHCFDAMTQKEIFNEVRRYYAGFPVMNGDYLVDHRIESQLMTLFAHCNDLDTTLDLLDRIYISRQVMTVIHSAMVSRLAYAITRELIREKPELFVGQLGCKTVEDVIRRETELEEFAGKAGRCHDIGKIVCSDVINLQGRRITDEEFELIRKHPEKGAELMDAMPALHPFREIALGHHRSFDGKRGYPESFDIRTLDKKIFMDIIKICDCIDAGTDQLGRNYAKTKEFTEVLEELKAESGTRYSDVLVDLIDRNEDLIRRIEELTRTEREFTYYEIYHRYVEPEVKFRPRDEKYVRLCRVSDLDKLAKINQSSAVSRQELFLQCQGRVFLVLDGYGNVYGYVFVEKHQQDYLEILEFVMEPKSRRHGYGTMLLNEVEHLARSGGYQRILMPLTEEGHFDKFGWRNGFVKSEFPGFMEKKL